MEHLYHIYQKKERLAIGLMSGTSCDGIDAALCRLQFSGKKTKATLLAFETFPYPSELRTRLFTVFDGQGNVEEICRLNFDVGNTFADAAIALLKQANYSPAQIDFIGSHGQTIFHAPPHSTLQIGEPDVICERTGVLTIADFRTRDMAAGGQGAPLVAYVDYLLFQSSEKQRVLQNLGGIGNVTWLDADPNRVLAFDTGPANVLIDWVATQMTQGLQTFDPGGSLAAQGKMNPLLLKKLMQHPYFEQKIPKTTGREMFHGSYLKEILKTLPSLDWQTILTTVTHFTAESIAHQYEKFLPKLPEEMIVSGGGVRNHFLMQCLSQRMPSMLIKSIETLGISSDGKEALAFAILANETIEGAPGNLISVTGARHPTILGKISLVRSRQK